MGATETRTQCRQSSIRDPIHNTVPFDEDGPVHIFMKQKRKSLHTSQELRTMQVIHVSTNIKKSQEVNRYYTGKATEWSR
jgi:hypothetical protein